MIKIPERVIFIAGPMRGVENYNYPLFDKVANILRGEDHLVFNPPDTDRMRGWTTEVDGKVELTDKFDLSEAFATCAKQVRFSHAIVLLPGWEKSEGARKEAQLALDEGLAFYASDSHGNLSALDARFVKRWLIETESPITPTTEQIVNATRGKAAEELHRILSALEANQSIWKDSNGQKTATEAVIMGETVRVTNPITGGQKDSKLERYDLLPVEALRQVARHYGIGARKYEDRNWELGYDWSLSYAALQRHAAAFWGGEDLDPEADEPTYHLSAIVFHALGLLHFTLHDVYHQFDDRPKGA